MVEILENKPIRRYNAVRSGQRLVAGLQKLGFRIKKVEGEIDRLPTQKIEKIAEDTYSFEQLGTIRSLDVPRSASNNYGDHDIILDNSYHMTMVNSVRFDFELEFEDQLFRAYLLHENSSPDDPHKLIVASYFAYQPQGIVSVDFLPDFTYFGLKYDLIEGQNTQDLKDLSDRRIPREILSRGTFTGKEVDPGFDSRISLTLQDSNLLHSCQCYEVELYSGNQKNIPQTSHVVPESRWQENQRHYCMTGNDSYPFFPMNIEEMSRLTMFVSFEGSSTPNLLAHFHDLPLSLDGKNQWFIGRKTGNNVLEVLQKPSWGENNLAIVSHHERNRRFSAQSVLAAAEEILSVRSSLVKNFS